MHPSLLGIQNKDYQSIQNFKLLLSIFSILINISDSSQFNGRSKRLWSSRIECL